LKFLALLLSTILTLAAQAAPRVTVTQSQREIGGSVSSKWKWMNVEDKAKALVLEVTVQDSQFAGYDRAVTKSKRIKPKLKGSELVVYMDGFAEKVLLAGPGGKLVLDFNASHDENKTLHGETCSAFSIELRSLTKRPPFYLGTNCIETNDNVAITITFPHEASLDNSSVFESKGKGEPWRQFELGNVKQAAGQIAKFTFKYLGKSYDFVLEADTPQATKTDDSPDRMTFAAGAGYTLAGISGSDLTVNDGKPTLALRVPHYPFIGGLGGGLSADIALPLSKNANSMSYLQLNLFGGYEIDAGAIKIRPQVGYVIYSQIHDDTQIGLSVTDLGVGLGIDIDLGGNFHLLVRGMKCGLASKVFSGHYDLELMGYYKKKGSTGFGLGAKMQSFAATSDLGIDRKFNTMLFYGLLAF